VIKTVESAEYTCRSQQCNSTKGAAILQMEIKHVAAYYFLRTIMWRVDLRGFVRRSSRNVALRVEHPSVLNKFFSEYNILPRSGVRAKSLRVGSKNTPNFVIFGPPCSLRITRKNPSSNFSNDTQGPPRIKHSRTSVNQGRKIRRP